MKNVLTSFETQPSRFDSWEQATAAKKKKAWKALAEINIQSAIQIWLDTLNVHTSKAYRCGLKKLYDLGLIDFDSSLQAFSQVNHNSVIDQIKLVDEWSEATRQARAACYISFTGFLSRRTNGIILKGIPLREGSAKTFFKIRHKVKTRAMSKKQWPFFFEQLEMINPRDTLIGKLMLQGGKRVSEVLSAKIQDINWPEREITYQQSKTKGMEHEIVITHPENIIQDLKKYLSGRVDGFIFITRNHRKIHPGQIERNFSKAGNRAGIPFKVTPHVLRASLVTYLKMNGYNDTDIMKVTGHHSAEMVASYDKLIDSDNLSKNVSLI